MRACALAQFSRAALYAPSRAKDQTALRLRITDLAHARPRFGYSRIRVLLRRAGWAVNRKRAPVARRRPTLALRLGAPLSTFARVTPDPYADLRDLVLRRVLTGPGDSDPAVRQAAAEGTGAPADLQALVDKIHRHAYRVTDDDVIRARGVYGDDQLFEIVVSAALGASRRRLLTGLEALDLA